MDYLKEYGSRTKFFLRVMYRNAQIGSKFGLLHVPRLLMQNLIQLAIILFVHACMFVDKYFFPAYQKEECTGKRMTVITGLPRTGSTFVQRQLMATDEYVTFKLWELIFPSLTARTIVRPFLPLLSPIYNYFGAAPPEETFGTKHMFDMEVADEEEFMLFHLMNSSYLTGFLSPTCFDQSLDHDMFLNDSQPAYRTDFFVRWFRGVMQRQFFWTGKQHAILKTPGAVLYFHKMRTAFPDARFVLLVRNPMDIIPSALSLALSYFEYVYGVGCESVIEKELKKYWEIAYERLQLWARVQVEDFGKLDKKRLLVVRFEDMMAQLDVEVAKIAEFAGVEMSKELEASVLAQAEVHRTRGHHKNKNQNLEKFGISEQKILKDFKFYYDAYGYTSSLRCNSDTNLTALRST
mmetsp:Transcript_19683/g.75513  ORF Transcript_19683/g.75513 Transcript_19683/m.75513 type:complete len:406 (-) Transcript_19683:152-1369(-)|eukprot:CAMPEP_0114610440 /NCGR_PEP_ID=MMETSP0168-20121206/3602_1 /TAXON_ID=95228 ORGANISM="Vannella sp., Strain DIVA3 517/6/12" /NCGR_SAMPLE_ID=MMETSP0168 /ASSEMBLY_ACC=CAM_ASM_000044 /LENGTH=405 /DNA_ID=CAMNT_0001821383 /DNA_START=174 /DNA_END=1391 /DNA_ORIENTATION=+